MPTFEPEAEKSLGTGTTMLFHSPRMTCARVVGIDFRVPTIDAWEVKIEAGFYDAFFLGLGVGYRL